MKRYGVLLACNVCMYKTVEVEAASPEEAEKTVQADFKKYDDDRAYEIDYDSMDEFRVVEDATIDAELLT